MAILENLKNKKILILGFGLEGTSTFLFLRKKVSPKILGIADRVEFKNLSKEQKSILKKEEERINTHFGRNYLKAIKNYEVIIKTPGIPLKIVKPFLKKWQILTSQTEIFFDIFRHKIIGVTGTKGKSTTASLINNILKKAGIKSILVGNIEKPALSYFSQAQKSRWIVMELSSHQLFGLRKSPVIAVLLNIYPEHLDYYKSFDEYISAKANIAKYQGINDCLIYDPQNIFVKKIICQSLAKKYPFSVKEAKKFIGKIPTTLNLKNVAAAITLSKILKIPFQFVRRGLEKFKTLPHRLEFAGKFKGIYFYNDSLATIPQATIDALENFGTAVETLILGGFDRGVAFRELADFIAKKSAVKNLIFFPTTGQRIWREIKIIKPHKELRPFFVKDMKEAVKLAYQKTSKNKICLLSPASPSFGVFKNYKERGDLFKKYIKYWSKKIN